ncbi:MAG: hypothetical protein QME51_04665 [Planctomycetota bacterium]|nr:hypothetical protein [Planctomycetota bacterium]
MIKPSYDENVWEKITDYDRALDLVWNCRLGRWEVWRNGRNRRVFVVRWENKDGSYRPLDKRLLYYLVNNDGWKYKDASAIASEMDEFDRKRTEKTDRELTNRFTEVAKYTRKKFARLDF